jgi:NitT/TauT family transport system ATP-binding protein
MELCFNQLAHTYPGRPPRRALAEVNFSVPSGQFFAILGPSGCGKSTLLRLAAGLLQPSSGEVLVDGEPPLLAAKEHRIAWLAQSPALLPWLTTRGNVELSLRFACRGENGLLSPSEALARVRLADSSDAYPFQLSGGMQQRVALARLLCQRAGVWLMDEPFAALDALTRELLAAEILRLWQPLQPTVLWVTHQIHEALRLADRVIVLEPCPGRVALDLPVDLPRPRRESEPSFQALLNRLRTELGLVVESEAR